MDLSRFLRLRNVVHQVFARYRPEPIARFWLASHSHGEMTCNRLLRDEVWAVRFDTDEGSRCDRGIRDELSWCNDEALMIPGKSSHTVYENGR